MSKEEKIKEMINNNLVDYKKSWGYSDSIISIKKLNTICSKFKVKLEIEIATKYLDISFIQNHENFCLRIIDTFYTIKSINIDTVFIPCDEFKDFIANEKDCPNMVSYSNEFGIVKILGKEYYRLWFD